jgi:ribosomal protein L17
MQAKSQDAWLDKIITLGKKKGTTVYMQAKSQDAWLDKIITLGKKKGARYKCIQKLSTTPRHYQLRT